jgi:hypothetical protein
VNDVLVVAIHLCVVLDVGEAIVIGKEENKVRFEGMTTERGHQKPPQHQQHQQHRRGATTPRSHCTVATGPLLALLLQQASAHRISAAASQQPARTAGGGGAGGRRAMRRASLLLDAGRWAAACCLRSWRVRIGCEDAAKDSFDLA